MLSSVARLCCAALAVLGGTTARAQTPAIPPQALPPPVAAAAPDTTARLYGSSLALAFQITEFGLGAGVAARRALTDDLSLVAEASLGAGRDEREQQFFVGFFGDSVIPFKRNYVLLVPAHAGLERRLFRRTVEDNFRPFVHLSGGPTLALQWPYFDDLDGDGLRDADEERQSGLEAFGEAQARLGIGATVSVGAAFGRSRRAAQSLRVGFTGQYFPAEVDLLELRDDIDRPSRSLFWTPVISVHIARL